MKTARRPAELRFLLNVLPRAGHFARTVRDRWDGTSHAKQDHTPVTVADLAVQVFLVDQIQSAFPGDRIVAEESAAPLRKPGGEQLKSDIKSHLGRVSGISLDGSLEAYLETGSEAGNPPFRRYWTIDPIDGTKGFIRGDQYATGVAYFEDGTPRVAGIAVPNLEEGYRDDYSGNGTLAVAVREEGAWRTPLFKEGSLEKLSVSSRENPREATVLRSFEADHTDVEMMEDLLAHLNIREEPRLMDSQAKYVVLACGEGDLLFRLLPVVRPAYEERIWDHAPGHLILHEAGGKMTDLDGREIDFSGGRRLTKNRGILATCGPPLHDRALDALRSV